MDDDPKRKDVLLHEMNEMKEAPPQSDPFLPATKGMTARQTAGVAPPALLLQMISVGVVVHDTQGRVIECNDAGARLLNLTQREMLARGARAEEWDFVDEADAPFLTEALPVNRVLATLQPLHETIVGVKRSGTEERVWLLVNAEPVFEGEERLAYVVCTFTDITERKRAELARRDSENRYRLLFDSNPQATLVYDVETLLILAANRAAIEQYGYAKDEFLNLHIGDLYGPEDAAALQSLLNAAPDSLDEPETGKHLRRDGATVDARLTTQALRYRDREARLVIAENITGRRHAERSLKRLNKRIANILESIRDGFVTLDRDWRFTFLNSRAEQIFRANRGELIGKNYWEVFPELRRAPLFLAYQKAMSKQNPVELEHRFADWDVWLKINVFPSQDGLSIYMADVTDRKRVEKELQDTIETLKRSVDGIVRAMSYAVELRDPYTAGHQRRVSLLVCAMARHNGLPAEDIERFRVAALLHDIGKIAMPAEILSKPGVLSRAEMSIIQGHAQLGYDILKGIDFAPEIALVSLQHHERLDGSGYPNGLSGDAIIPEAKMMAVADVVEAMASHRPFRPSLGIEKALNEVLRNKGVLYDPAAVEACIAVFAQHGFDFENLLRFEQDAIPQEPETAP